MDKKVEKSVYIYQKNRLDSMKTPRVSVEQWRVLQAVVDHGGFAQAAEYLHRSQSAVSYTVAKLQSLLGVPLLEMEGRKARLTDAGKTLLDRSRQLVKESVELEQFAESLGKGREPEVRLVVDVVVPDTVLTCALAAFARASRGTRVEMREEVLSGVDDAIEDGVADLAIGWNVPAGHLGDRLLEVGFVALAAPNHPLHQLGRELHPSDLESETQVVIRDSGRRRQSKGWLTTKNRWVVTSLERAAALVRSGLGFAWLPTHAVEEDLAQSGLLPLPLSEGQRYPSSLYLILPRSETAGPATRQLAEILRNEAECR